MHRFFQCVGLALLLAPVLSACRPEAGAPSAGEGRDTAQAAAPGTTSATDDAGLELEDVMESDPRYIIGISYPPDIERYPGLAAELKRYADAARGELMDAVRARDPGDGGGGVPYDLTLSYDVLMDTPAVVAVQAWGTLYTGGAHGNPLVARFVWLPQRGELLRAQALLADETGWREVSAFVRESLQVALGHRLDADDLEPEDRTRLLRSGSRMIEEGTAAESANFAQFEPVAGAGGRLRALRFVFPPYQVGPYSDGIQTVEVPAAVFRSYLAPEYRDLFEAG